jgi:hypothetical protein
MLNTSTMENYIALKEETEEDTRICKDLPCLWISKINIIKMAIIRPNMVVHAYTPSYSEGSN